MKGRSVSKEALKDLKRAFHSRSDAERMRKKACDAKKLEQEARDEERRIALAARHARAAALKEARRRKTATPTEVSHSDRFTSIVLAKLRETSPSLDEVLADTPPASCSDAETLVRHVVAIAAASGLLHAGQQLLGAEGVHPDGCRWMVQLLRHLHPDKFNASKAPKASKAYLTQMTTSVNLAREAMKMDAANWM